MAIAVKASPSGAYAKGPLRILTETTFSYFFVPLLREGQEARDKYGQVFINVHTRKIRLFVFLRFSMAQSGRRFVNAQQARMSPRNSEIGTIWSKCQALPRFSQVIPFRNCRCRCARNVVIS